MRQSFHEKNVVKPTSYARAGEIKTVLWAVGAAARVFALLSSVCNVERASYWYVETRGALDVKDSSRCQISLSFEPLSLSRVRILFYGLHVALSAVKRSPSPESLMKYT
jgi:hypothetical protein